jgi:hypothetical protein
LERKPGRKLHGGSGLDGKIILKLIEDKDERACAV